MLGRVLIPLGVEESSEIRLSVNVRIRNESSGELMVIGGCIDTFNLSNSPWIALSQTHLPMPEGSLLDWRTAWDTGVDLIYSSDWMDNGWMISSMVQMDQPCQ